MLNFMQNWTNVDNPRSWSSRFRSRRFQLFAQLADSLPRPVSILDIGGTVTFWERCRWVGLEGVRITIANLTEQLSSHANVTTCIADATNLSQFSDGSFDIAFSNSVIEHLFTFDAQQRMAAEMQRIARAVWLQTPNYWFPMEPHFHIPGWQWLPMPVRIAMIRRMRCGNRGPCSDPSEAASLVREVRLLSARELRHLFPQGTLVSERFAGITKSWIVAQGFPGLLSQPTAASLTSAFQRLTSPPLRVQQ